MPSVERIAVWAALLFIATWIVVVVASGAGWNPFGTEWDFSNTGTFGDSFGPLSATMAGLAALSAIAALRSQQGEISRLKGRESSEDVRAHRADFERTFFQLLGSLRDIVRMIDIEKGTQARTGQDAFRSILYTYVNSGGISNSTEAWHRVFNKYKNDLGHYFRFLYHLVRFIDGDDGVDRYFYARLVRASMSDSELILLGLNCAHGEGREKFARLVERYSLLHNLSEEDVNKHRLREQFGAGAFDHVAEPNLLQQA